MSRRLRSLRALAVLIAALALPQLTAEAEPTRQKLPFIGIGPAMGWELGDLDGLSFEGPAMELRFAALLPTYPITAIALDAKFSRVAIGVDGTDLTADRVTAGPTVGLMIPFDLFGIELAGAPRGAGLPIFLGLVGLDRLALANEGGSFRGLGFKAGLQIPLGKLVVQLEYARTQFGDIGDSALTIEDSVAADTFGIKLQIPVIFLEHD